MEENVCVCMECRIRAAMQNIKVGDPPREMTGKEMTDALNAMGNITGEILSHVPTKMAKLYASELLESRKQWMLHPRVMVQKHPEGHA